MFFVSDFRSKTKSLSGKPCARGHTCPIFEMKGKNGPEMAQKCEKTRDTTK